MKLKIEIEKSQLKLSLSPLKFIEYQFISSINFNISHYFYVISSSTCSTVTTNDFY